MDVPHVPRINWQPLVDSVAFAVKAAGLSFVGMAILASNLSDLSEVKGALLIGLISGVVKGGTPKLPESWKKFGV